MKYPQSISRRTALKTTAGLLTFASLSSSASAKPYGNGNGLDEFLNEEAVFKESPIWDGEIANRMGQSVVDVAVGAMTSIDNDALQKYVTIPDAVTVLPVGFSPQVVKVSPGATVRWTWVSNPLGHPIPHDVSSLVDENGNVVFDPHDARFHKHHRYKEGRDAPEPDPDDLPTFEVEFTERGNHLYYCTPHGAPFEVHSHITGEDIFNEFGMRGAVKVAGKALSESE